jgi:hypothetical protein
VLDTPVKSAFAVSGPGGTDRYGGHMRRHLVLAAAMAGLLILSACGSDSSTRRTVTAVVTVSSGADASASAAESGAPASSGAEEPPAESAEVSASPSPSAASSSVSAAPIVVVDPLKADCAAVLSAADVKKALNVDIPNDRIKVNVAEVNGDVGQTGRVRCFYGLAADKKSGQVTIALTQYTDAAAAQAQVDVTMQNESDQGAQITPVTVSGYPAQVAVRDGGLLVMAYDNWTLAIATAATTDPAVLVAGLPLLAEPALARILKG